MTSALTHAEASELLAAYASSTLDDVRQSEVASHLSTCAECQRDVEAWSMVRTVVRTASLSAAPSREVLEGIRLRVAAEPRTHGLRFLLDLLIAQFPLVRQQIWVASALVMTLGFAVGLASDDRAGSILAFLAPLIAAAGVAFIYGPGNDPPLELALATPTSPRLVLLARLTIVFGYDFLLAVASSGMLATLGRAPEGIVALVQEWLGAMLLLSTISLWLSLRFGPMAGASIAMTLWGIQVALGQESHLAWLYSTKVLASTNVYTVGFAAIIAAAVFFQLPRQERLA